MTVKVLVVILPVLVAVVLVLVVLFRWGRRSYQHYSGLELQRVSAKQSRVAAADRLKTAERKLVEAQRDLAVLGKHAEAQEIERQRLRPSTLADRLCHAVYGYSPVGSPRPVREEELAEFQQRDADTIAESQMIVDLADEIRHGAATGADPELGRLTSALDLLQETLDRRRLVT